MAAKVIAKKGLIQGWISCLAHWQGVRMSVRYSPCRMFELCSYLLVLWLENGKRGQFPSSWRFIVENMTTKPQPHSVSTQEQNQATSSLLLSCLAWDILCLSLEGHQCPLTFLAIAVPWHSPSSPVIPGRWEAEVQQGWHQVGSGHSGTCAWPVCQCCLRGAANPASCCPSKSLLVAACHSKTLLS